MRVFHCLSKYVHKQMMSTSPSEISYASSCDIHYRPEPPVRKKRIRSFLVIKCIFFFCYKYGQISISWWDNWQFIVWILRSNNFLFVICMCVALPLSHLLTYMYYVETVMMPFSFYQSLDRHVLLFDNVPSGRSFFTQASEWDSER